MLAERLLDRIAIMGHVTLASPDLATAMASDDLHHLGLARQSILGESIILSPIGGAR